MTRHEKTTNRRRVCPVSAQLQNPNRQLGISRTKVAYWRSRVEKVKSSQGTASPDYSARITFNGKRVRFPLHISNKEAAASKAAKIYKYLIQYGWDETIREFKPESIPEPEMPPAVTVGDLFRVSAKYSTARQASFRTYTQSFRKIVGDIMDIPKGNARKNHPNQHIRWQDEIDAVALEKITPAKIQQWRQANISQFSDDPIAKRKRTVTTNSQIRNGKALFSKRILPFIKQELELPDPLPFEDVQAEKVGSLRYHSRIDARKLMEDAETEVKDRYPESYKIFLLALVCGLRVSEIDHLLWSSVDLDNQTLHVRSSKYHQLKSEDSEGLLNLGEIVTEHLKECKKHAVDQFVIIASEANKKQTQYYYRCQKHVNVLRNWLREQGIDDQKPIHTLRKEVGSLIASEQGIFAASRYLRHSDIQVTAAYYADAKNKILPSIGNAL